MVRLKNIVKNKDVISASYEPEDTGELGYLEINKEGTVLSKRYSEYDKDFPRYYQHALLELRRLALLDNPPKESTAMWY